MTLELTWLDLVLVTLLAGVVVLGARRGLLGLVSAILSLLLWLVVNAFGSLHPLLGFGLALALGAGMAMLGRNLLSDLMQNLSDFANQAAGGLGGFIIGLSLICTLALSFPRSENPINKGYNYPSVGLPVWLNEAVTGSAVQKWLVNSPTRGGLGIWSSSGAVVLKNLFTPDVDVK
jgi:hypothetical protein